MQAAYDIGEDLNSLRKNKLYTKERTDEERKYLFDIDDYPLKAPQLILDNYKLPEAELKEYAGIVTRLRSMILDKARAILGLNL